MKLPLTPSEIDSLIRTGLFHEDDCNYDRAEEYYQQAADAGDPWAIFRMRGDEGHDADVIDKWMPHLLSAAENGHAWCMYELGTQYEEGNYTEEDTEKAIYWYERAAAAGLSEGEVAAAVLRFNTTGEGAHQLAIALQHQAEAGNAISLYHLAVLYQQGIGVEQNGHKAIALAEAAAERDVRIAALMAATYYDTAPKRNKQKAARYYAIAAWVETLGHDEAPTFFLPYPPPKLPDIPHLDCSFALKRAAELGHPAALFRLGQQHRDAEEYPAMLSYYKKAVHRGHVKAMTELGWAYYWGKGVKRNWRKSVALFRRASAAGDALAMYNLGIRLLDGEGTPQNTEEGILWLKRAMRAGNPFAPSVLGGIYLNGEYGTPKAPKKGISYLRLGVRRNDCCAANNLGLAYYEGNGVPRNYKLAFRYYKLATKLDSTDEVSVYNQGVCLLLGRGVKADYEAAVAKFRLSAKSNYDSALAYLGFCYQYGYGVELNLQEAISYYKKAVAEGSKNARAALRHLHAPLPEQNIATQQLLFEKARQQHDTHAMRAIGLLYENGQDIRRSLSLARRWYTAAALLGDTEAYADLKRIARAPDKEYF